MLLLVFRTLSLRTSMQPRLVALRSAFRRCRRFTTFQPQNVNATPPPKPQNLQSRIDSFINRSPKVIRPTLARLRDAPISHVTAFLILHELTAVLPLFGLAGTFHYFNWLPPYFAEGQWIASGVERFGRYFRKKGWISDRDEAEAEKLAREGKDGRSIEEGMAKNWWSQGEGTVRWVIEFATAYAVVKALLPLRLLVSAWGAPWFATWTVIPVSTRIAAVARFWRKTPP